MLSILVCHSYFLRLDQKQTLRAKAYPPLATLQVVALLRSAGHHVRFFDAMLSDGRDEYEVLLAAERPQLVLFYEDTFNFLSKMCLATMRRAACEMISVARDAGARIIVAGPDVSDAPMPYLRAGADLTLLGEGLTSLLELLPRLETQPGLEAAVWAQGVAGVRHAAHGRAVQPALGTAPLAARVSLAAWDLVDIERYRRLWMKAHGFFSLNMAASRGCSFRCTWCAKPIWGNQYLQRDPREVASEMAFLKRSFKPDHIWFADDIFGFKVAWVREFTDALRAESAMVPFTIQTRADLISEDMAGALREAGCQEAWIGAESGSQRVLDAMNKGTTVQEILVARERLGRVGIRVGFFIQLGYTGEGLEDIVATRHLLQQAQPDDIGVSVSYPLPGTRFYESVKAQLRAKTNWDESDDLDMMFQGAFSSEFYRSVRNLLHEQVLLQDAQPPVRLPLELRWQQVLGGASGDAAPQARAQ